MRAICIDKKGKMQRRTNQDRGREVRNGGRGKEGSNIVKDKTHTEREGEKKGEVKVIMSDSFEFLWSPPTDSLRISLFYSSH